MPSMIRCIVRAVFRGKYLHYLRMALDRGQLVLPEGMGPQQARNLFNKLGRRKTFAFSMVGAWPQMIFQNPGISPSFHKLKE